MVKNEISPGRTNRDIVLSDQAEQHCISIQHSAITIAVLTQQISHYHAARYQASAPRFKRFSIISAMNGADFEEFLSQDLSRLDVTRLFEGKAAYLAAVANGNLYSATITTLNAIMPDVVAVAGWSFPESLAAISWARNNSCRIIMMSASQGVDAKRYHHRENIKSRIVAACDTALVGGVMQEKYMAQLGMQKEKIFVGYDVVDNNHFAQGALRARERAADLKSKYGLPQRYIIASARFIPKKNLTFLVQAFSDAVKRTSTSHSLVILGNGQDRSKIEAAALTAGIKDRVYLPGFADYQTLPIYLGLAEGFVHVSIAEQWGLVINEAAAAGLPLIVSKICGAASELVVEGRNGTLVDPSNLASVTQALSALMLASDERRRLQGAESRDIVSNWGTERFADGLSSAVESAMQESSRSLSIIDRCLFRALSRHYISSTS